MFIRSARTFFNTYNDIPTSTSNTSQSFQSFASIITHVKNIVFSLQLFIATLFGTFSGHCSNSGPNYINVLFEYSKFSVTCFCRGPSFSFVSHSIRLRPLVYKVRVHFNFQQSGVLTTLYDNENVRELIKFTPKTFPYNMFYRLRRGFYVTERGTMTSVIHPLV